MHYSQRQGVTSKTAEHILDRKWGPGMQLPWKRLGNSLRWPERETRIQWVHQWQNAEGKEVGTGIIPGGGLSCPKGGGLCTAGLSSPCKAGATWGSSHSSATRMLSSGFSPSPSYISAHILDTWPVTSALGFCLDFCRIFVENDDWKVQLPKMFSAASGVLQLGCSSHWHPLERLLQR